MCSLPSDDRNWAGRLPFTDTFVTDSASDRSSVNVRSDASVTAVIVALNFGHGLMFAPESAYFPELFGARVRYSGASFGFQASAAIGGGFAPIIATALAAYMGGTAGVSVMLILLALLTLVATFFAHETKDQPLLK